MPSGLVKKQQSLMRGGMGIHEQPKIGRKYVLQNLDWIIFIVFF